MSSFLGDHNDPVAILDIFVVTLAGKIPPIPILTSTEQATETLHFSHQGSYLRNSSRILPEKLFLKVEHTLICMLLNHHSSLLLMRDLATGDNRPGDSEESVVKGSKRCGVTQKVLEFTLKSGAALKW